MTDNEIFIKLKKLYKKLDLLYYLNDLDNLQIDSNLYSDLGLTSLDVVELIMQVEHDFKVKFSFDSISLMKTNRDIIDGIQRQINNK